MKKLLVVMTAILLLTFVPFANATDVTQTLIFQWEQSDTIDLKDWRLYWSDTADGPYDEVPVAVIPYDPNATGPTYSSPTSATVAGNPGTTVTKYFVLVACGDKPQSDGTTNYLCSANSNEVSHGFWIPAGQFSAPVQFTITVIP